MKKMKLAIVPCILISFALAACGTGTTQQGTTNQAASSTLQQTSSAATTQGTAAYKDGTYTGAGDPWSHGSESATVVIKDGKITGITLARLDTAGKEVDYSQWTGQPVNGTTYPNLREFRVDLANNMIQKQSSDVDTITSATTSTTNWKVAVQRALDKAH